MSQASLPEPRRVAIGPFDCFQRAGELVRNDYWLFVGVTTVGLLLAALVPFGLLNAPLYAGMYALFASKQRGRPVAFDQLFSRFDTFVQGLIATLVYVAAIAILLVPVYLFSAMAWIGGTAAMEDHNEGLGIALFCLGGSGYLIASVFALLAQVAFTFTYALLAEHRIEGLAALRLSLRAARMNFWGVLGLVLLVALLSSVSMLLCCVPFVLVLPYVVGAPWVAYRKIFGEPPASAADGAPGLAVPDGGAVQGWSSDV